MPRESHGLGQQVVHLRRHRTAVAQLVDEVEMIALGVIDPQDVVEKQVVAIGGRRADAPVLARTP